VFPDRIVSSPVLLRTFNMSDAPRVQTLASDPRVAEPTGVIPQPYGDGTAEAWIASHERTRTTGAEFVYAITRHEDGLLVGAIALRPAANEHENLGYWIGHPYWQRGYATAAARALVALAFSWLDCEMVTASHLARNPASGRVMEKCGFSVIRREIRPHRGALEDHVVYGITADAWQQWIESPASEDRRPAMS
jgi:RimJ/RimL family protein N-acetyltransferase